jgi:outer membrane beta-barrel protein
MSKLLCLLTALLLGAHAFAEDIEVPEDELARETTLPVFNKRRIVLNRNVITEKRVEIGAGAGVEMNEPFYNTLMYGAQGTYNFNDTSAMNVQGLFWASGSSSYGDQLKQTTPKHQYFDASKAPHPTWALMLNYEYVAYYGKISVTKQTVMNLNTFGIAGLGYLSLSPLSTVAADLGIGQNFFFTSNFGIRWDLRWLIFQGPDPTSQQLGPTNNPSAGSFSNRLYYNSQLALSAVFIL